MYSGPLSCAIWLFVLFSCFVKQNCEAVNCFVPFHVYFLMKLIYSQTVQPFDVWGHTKHFVDDWGMHWLRLWGKTDKTFLFCLIFLGPTLCFVYMYCISWLKMTIMPSVLNIIASASYGGHQKQANQTKRNVRDHIWLWGVRVLTLAIYGRQLQFLHGPEEHRLVLLILGTIWSNMEVLSVVFCCDVFPLSSLSYMTLGFFSNSPFKY